MRVTVKHLQAIVDRINRMTNSPTEPWVKDENGKYVAQVRNYHLSGAYGGYALHRMQNKSGGITDELGVGQKRKKGVN